MPKRNQGKRRAPREVSEPKETPKRKQGEIRVAIKTKTPPTKISTGEQKRRRPDGSDGGAHHEASREEYPGDDAANGKSKRMRSRSPEVVRRKYDIPEELGSGKPCIRKAPPPKEPPAKRHLFTDYVFRGKPSQSDYGPGFTVHNERDNRFYPTRDCHFMAEEATKAWTCRHTRYYGSSDYWVCAGCSTTYKPDKQICGKCSTARNVWRKNDWICPSEKCDNHNFEDLTGLSL